MAYYDRIAKHWHKVTGYKGGAFKRHLLNDAIINKIEHITDKNILELGAGNGYFVPFMLRQFPGQRPSHIVITDISKVLLQIARSHFPVEGAQYIFLDVHRKFDFKDESFHLILASMIFNEISDTGVKNALIECHRVLKKDGQLIISIIHPLFVLSLEKRNMLKKKVYGRLTMPGSDGIRLPVVKRSLKKYLNLLDDFQIGIKEIAPTPQLLNEKPGLRQARGVPLAAVFNCVKRFKQ